MTDILRSLAAKKAWQTMRERGIRPQAKNGVEMTPGLHTKIKGVLSGWTSEEMSIMCGLAQSDDMDWKTAKATFPDLFKAHKLDDIKAKTAEVRSQLIIEEEERQKKELFFKHNASGSLKNDVKMKILEDRIVAKIEEVAGRHRVLPPARFPKYKVNVSTESFVANIADVHWGEVVLKEAMRNLNEYDIATAKKRLRQFTESLLKIRDKMKNFNFDEIIVNLMGDMFSGTIHDELLRTNELTPVEWYRDLGDVIIDMLTIFQREFPRVRVNGVSGNHGRFFQKPYFKQHYFNWDMMLYTHVAKVMEKSGITFNFPKSMFLVDDIKGWKFFITHGDAVKGWQGMPWYIVPLQHQLNLAVLIICYMLRTDIAKLMNVYSGGKDVVMV